MNTFSIFSDSGECKICGDKGHGSDEMGSKPRRDHDQVEWDPETSGDQNGGEWGDNSGNDYGWNGEDDYGWNHGGNEGIYSLDNLLMYKIT